MSSDLGPNKYGFVGWKEMDASRRDILADFDSTREKNQSRKVRAKHGLTGEAAVRKWLTQFLPKRFAVTKGFVIPERISTDYVLGEYDVIIYDQQASPVLWVDDSSADESTQGNLRAIPAKYVYSVAECKATLEKRTSEDVRDKLLELSVFANEFPQEFSAFVVFMDVRVSASHRDVSPLADERLRTVSFRGGLVLRGPSTGPGGMYQSGRIDFPAPAPVESHPTQPLVFDVDLLSEIEIVRPPGEPVHFQYLDDNRRGFNLVAKFDGSWHYTSEHVTWISGDHDGLSLRWSYNAFTTSAFDLVRRLEGMPTIADSTGDLSPYGLVFHQPIDKGRTTLYPNGTILRFEIE